MKKPRYVCTEIQLADRRIAVYAGKHVLETLNLISELDFYKGVKILDLLNVLYAQGEKDGARKVFELVDELKNDVLHRNPGAPRKLKKSKSLKTEK